MIYEIKDGKKILIDYHKPNIDEYYFGVLPAMDARKSLEFFHVQNDLFDHVLKNKAVRFEARENVDVFCVPLININESDVKSAEVVYFFLTKYSLLVVCNTDCKNAFNIATDELSFTSERFITNFFENITRKDAGFLEDMEKEMNILEDEVLLNHQAKNLIEKIIYYRKKISILKHYYEQLLDLFDTLEENENNLLNSHALRYFKILDGRIDRLYHNVLSLGDYISQIREAYQSEVDISLNQTMKLFTVITAIFFPLTLIVGWYGMNLKMPEYNWAYGYPLVILASIFIVIGCSFYFKKHKWF